MRESTALNIAFQSLIRNVAECSNLQMAVCGGLIEAASSVSLGVTKKYVRS